MTSSAHNGFTKIELLTVIAIITVLASLLLPTLGGAKRNSRQAVCLSRLRQLGLGIDLYEEDFAVHPASMQALANYSYVVEAVLLCADDPTGNWGGIFQEATRRAISPEEPAESVHYSYVNNLRWDQWLMAELMKVSGPSAGVAVCQLHGDRIGRQDQPTIAEYEGRLLRLQTDGAVVRRKILWRRDGALIVADPCNFSPTPLDRCGMTSRAFFSSRFCQG